MMISNTDAMTLILSIVAYKQQPPAQPCAERYFDGIVSIGRTSDNTLVLQDPEKSVSRKHCVITPQGGSYQISDRSRNGTFINSASEPVGTEWSVLLQDGDRLRLGDYDILVRIVPNKDAVSGIREAGAMQDAELDPFIDLPLASLDPFGLQRRGHSLLTSPSAGATGSGIAAFNFDAPFQNDPFAAPAPIPGLAPIDGVLPAPQWGEHWPASAQSRGDGDWPNTPSDHAAPERAFVRAPRIAQAQIPENWQQLLGPTMPSQPVSGSTPDAALALSGGAGNISRQAPSADSLEQGFVQQPSPPSPIPAAGRDQRSAPRASGRDASGDALLGAFLDGAGLQPTSLSGEDSLETMRQLGQLVREMVLGLSEILTTRAMVKTEYRVEQTVMRASNNNPLKLSPDIDETLTMLLGPARRGFLPGPRAVKEGFSDIKAHELALLAAMQAAVIALLRQFDPELLKTRLEQKSVLHAIMPAMVKAKYWEAYEKHYRQIAADVSEDVRGIFGRAFARAYEEQVKTYRVRTAEQAFAASDCET
jgi:type VI secretion system protein